MNTTLQDTIEKELVVRAPIEQVYKAIADPGQIVKWFPDGIEGSLAPGEKPVLDFGEYGKSVIHVVAAEPHHYFAYRWVPGGNAPEIAMADPLSLPNTLVEFRLEGVPDGTKVQMVESGFASLPAEAYEKAVSMNTQGWDYMLGRLAIYVAGE